MATITDLATAIARQEGNSFGNNPGNLRYAGQLGATKGPNGFAVFSSPELGWQALERQIALDAASGKTLSSFLNKYAPSSENDTSTYIRNVSSWTGIQPTDKLLDVLGQNTVSDFFVPTPASGQETSGGALDWSNWFGPTDTGLPSDMSMELAGMPLWAWLAASGVAIFLLLRQR